MSLTVPNTFTARTRILAAKVNENFTALAEGALPLAGGILTGSLLGGASVDLGSALAAFHDLFLSRDAQIGGDVFVEGEVSAETFRGDLVGEVDGNCSGSSGSCTGNAATATTASACSGQAATALSAAACTGNAATVTNGVVTTGSYANPSWITSLAASKITDLPSATIPSGTILPFGANAAPTGYLLCDGTEYAKASYTALYDVIGVNFGGTPGVSFKVPDLRDTFPIGKSGTKAVGSTGGGTQHDHAYQTVIAHTHTASQASHTHTYSTLEGGGDGSDYPAAATAGAVRSLTSGSAQPSVTVESTGSAYGNTNLVSHLPTYVALAFIIKT
jgi:microcystin-dependent protein